MLRIAKLMFLGLCTAGLVSCSGTSEVNTAAGATLKLNRLSNGDLQYCNDAGECQNLPYGGECATIQITIDTASGDTCQTCILADGTEVDQGCSNTAVACVLVTLPDPDCVICAYVNGAIIYSTCVAAQPACTSDADCAGGRCVNGECVVDPQCQSDADCPAGFECAIDMCPMTACSSDGTCPACTGSCVPKPLDCQVNTDCPVGMECHVYCMGACDPTQGTVCPDACRGVCEPVQTGCNGNGDCPAGFVCEPSACAQLCTPDGSGGCVNNCPNICVPAAVQCSADSECPAGYVCEITGSECPPPTDPPQGRPCQEVGQCVPAGGTDCSTNSDCAPGMECHTYCTGYCDSSNGMACPTPADACKSVCEPIPPTTSCSSNMECGPGMECVATCDTNCDPASSNCAGICGGICEPVVQGCASDSDCAAGYVCAFPGCAVGTDSSGQPCAAGPGQCVPVTPTPGCLSNAQCPAGETCVWDPTTVCPEVFCVPSAGTACTLPPQCAGTCEATGYACAVDTDCRSSAGTAGVCVNGQCSFRAP